MTLKEKRAFLARYRFIRLAVDIRKDEIHKIQTQSIRTTEEITVIEKELSAEITEYENQRAQICKLVESIYDENLRELLTLRYIQGFTVEQIADLKHYDERTVRRRINKAVLSIQFPPFSLLF